MLFVCIEPTKPLRQLVCIEVNFNRLFLLVHLLVHVREVDQRGLEWSDTTGLADKDKTARPHLACRSHGLVHRERHDQCTGSDGRGL